MSQVWSHTRDHSLCLSLSIRAASNLSTYYKWIKRMMMKPINTVECTGILSQIRIKLSDWAVWQARARPAATLREQCPQVAQRGCNSWPQILTTDPSSQLAGCILAPRPLCKQQSWPPESLSIQQMTPPLFSHVPSLPPFCLREISGS